MKNFNVYVRITGVLAIALLLGACILQPDSDKTGSVEIRVASGEAAASSIGASNVGAAPTHARIWLYQNGEDFRQTMLNLDSNRTVKFEGIPEGEGYSLVAVLGTVTGNPEIFLPSAYARSEAFTVSAGRETVVAPARQDIAGADGLVAALEYPANLVGKSVGSVVRVGTQWFAAVPGEQNVYYGAAGGAGTSTRTPSRLFSVSAGTTGATSRTLFVNTAAGILASFPSSTTPLTNSPANVVDSGAFFINADDPDVTEDAVVIYYSRLQGLGGVSVLNLGAPAIDWVWGDSEDGLDELVGETESPIRVMATDGTRSAYIASVLGTFKMTRDFIDQADIDVGALLGGDDGGTAGFTFFGVAYPGSARPMRVDQIGLIPGSPNRIIVGTGRGAFFFNGDVVDRGLTATGLVPGSALTQINVPGVQDRAILGISVGETRVAIATRERLTVLNRNDLQSAVLQFPMRAIALGQPQRVYLDPSGWLYIAADEGLTAILLKP